MHACYSGQANSWANIQLLVQDDLLSLQIPSGQGENPCLHAVGEEGRRGLQDLQEDHVRHAG